MLHSAQSGQAVLLRMCSQADTLQRLGGCDESTGAVKVGLFMQTPSTGFFYPSVHDCPAIPRVVLPNLVVFVRRWRLSVAQEEQGRMVQIA